MRKRFEKLERVTPVLPSHPRTLKDNRCNSLITDAGVLVAINGYGPTPPLGGTYYHWRETTRPLPLLYSQEKREPAFLPRLLIYVLVVPPPGDVILLKEA
ncbi:hypothetical protein AVEN_210494-1 [Araneus ventricosus]|uniref:Uncharacterized protein n=1 Tax=Araneus ventricosus TaxID=182803 RepID=A0A4Y2MP92_ARAVE|nr:hypothetical protein AVEN_210494-1 [Araneus ventricosus]